MSLTQHFKYPVLVGIAFLFLSSCAAKQDVKSDPHPAQTQPEQSAGHDSTPPEPSLSGISAQVIDQTCTLNITTTTVPTYTVFKLSNPDRIIIDLPDIALADYTDTVSFDNSFIASVSSSELHDGDSRFLRITVHLRNSINYIAECNDKTISIQMHKTGQQTAAAPLDIPSPEPPAARTLDDIKIVPSKSKTIIEIISGSEIDKYFSYTLQNPNRLVVDLPDVQNGMARREINVQSPILGSVRIGTQPDLTRVVLDLVSDTFPLYEMSQSGNTLHVNLMHESSAPEKNETPEPAMADTGNNMKEDSIDIPPEPPADTAETAPPAEESLEIEKISFDFKDADIKNVLRLIADISGMNMIVSDTVAGNVTLKLENIPWTEALDLILETNGLGKIETKNITRIETRDQIKKINQEKLLAKRSQEEIEELVVRSFNISYAKASDLASFIKQMKVLSDRGSVTNFQHTNNITVQDIAANIPKIERIIREQDIPTRQVMIEARIVQSNPSVVKELGIRWGGTYATTHNNDGINVNGAAGNDYIVNLPAAAGEGAGGAFNFGYIKNNLDLNIQLTALENEDKLKIISNPRILGLDNKNARIKQGVALPYLKLSEEGVTSTEFKDAVLELTVTPKITPADTIALHIFVTKNQKSSQTGAGNEPGIDVREVETDLLVKSGETVVIGGIYETQKTLNIKKVPLLADIPYLGYAFKSTKEEETLTELLVFITVTIVDNPSIIAHYK